MKFRYSVCGLTKVLSLIVFFAILTIPNPTLADYTSNLVGWWKLDEGTGVTTVDSSGNGKDASLYSGSSWASGVSGNSLQFDGITGYAQATTTTSISFANPVTVSVLAKRNSGTDYKEFFNLTDSAGKQVVNIAYGSTWNGILASRNDNTTAPRGMKLSTAITQSSWNHIVVVNPGGNATSTIYVNGAINSATSSNTSSKYGGASVIQFGKGISDLYNTAATIDDVRIYNRVLSDSDISSLFANYSSSSPTVTGFSVDSSATMSVFATTADVPVNTFTATDMFGVTGYLINESSTSPTLDDIGWSSSVPSSVTVSGSGEHTLFAWVKNGGNIISTSATSSVTVSVTELTVGPASLQEAVQGLSYSQAVSTQSGGSTYIWSISSGSLPAGLSLDTNSNTDTANISGTPTTAGQYTFTVQVNADGHIATQTYVMTIVAFPTFTANSDIVQVAPYDTITTTGAGNYGTTNSASRDFITIGQRYRIRQNGTVTKIRLFVSNSVGDINGLYLKIWRYNGTTYDLVGTSENLFGSIVPNSINTLTLASPISGVREGDYYGYREEGVTSPGYVFIAKTGVSGVTTYYVDNSTPATTNYNWPAQTASSGATVPIELYMQAPQITFIGDSLIAGHPGNYSFLETTATTDLSSTIESQFGSLSGYSYQNLGIGSMTTTNISTRFSNDSTVPLASLVNTHPRIALVEGGVNDIAGSVSKSTFISNWTSILNAAQSDPSISTIIVLKILPWTNGTSNQMQTRDDWNNSLAALAGNYSKAFVIDAEGYVGQNRSGGDANNLWDIKTAYNADGVHMNGSGYAQVAQAIFDAFSTTTLISSVQAITGNNSATIGWVTNQNSTSQVDFGLDTTYGTSTDISDSITSTTTHSISISNIPSCSTIHYRVRSKNALTNETIGSDNIFTTTGCTGNSGVVASTTSTVSTSVGATVNLDSITINIPTNYSGTTTSAVFQIKRLDPADFLTIANDLSGKSIAGNYFYNLESLIDATTTLLTFSEPISVSISYTADNISGIDESSLKIYRYDGLVWNVTNNCNVNVSTKTVTCETNNFSDFALFGDALPAVSANQNAVTTSISSSGSFTPAAREAWLRALYKKNNLPYPGDNVVVIAKDPFSFSRDLKIGVSGSDVKNLQKILNQLGFALDKTGPGSPGFETEYFGIKTKRSLMKFQLAFKNEILNPLGLSTPTGYFGQSTRKYIEQLHLNLEK